MGYAGSYETLKVFVRSIKEQKCRIAYTRFNGAGAPSPGRLGRLQDPG